LYSLSSIKYMPPPIPPYIDADTIS
jgi:hypothetical protein